MGVAAFSLYEEKVEYNIQKTLKYSFTITNPTNRYVENSSMWIYIPVKKTSTQKFISVETSRDYELVEDSLGNQKLIFNLNGFAPYGSKVISIKVRVDMSDSPNFSVVKDHTLYLREEEYIESDNEAIVTLATDLVRTDEIATAESIYSWVLDNMEYKGYVPNDRGALFAFEEGEGDCTEYAYFVTALARASNLPSRSVAGFVYHENARVSVKDYHNWSEVIVGEKWWIVDAQKENFMEKSADYVAMRIISNKEGDNSNNSQKYYHISSPLVAEM